ncbi:hypothetical protein D3C80_1780880 [compost metagenome]
MFFAPTLHEDCCASTAAVSIPNPANLPVSKEGITKARYAVLVSNLRGHISLLMILSLFGLSRLFSVFKKASNSVVDACPSFT